MHSRATREVILQRLQEGDVRDKLKQMEQDPLCNTNSSYSANALLYPDHSISFTEKHIAYLLNHPQVDHAQYLSNLRLMIKVRI